MGPYMRLMGTVEKMAGKTGLISKKIYYGLFKL
jgi:hypothetical protein